MKNEQKSCTETNKQRNSAHISRMVAQLDEYAYNAYALLKNEIEHHNMSNSVEMSTYLVKLQCLEKRLDVLNHEYDIEFHNTVIPMVRAFRQEQEKLEQQHKQHNVRFIRHCVPVLQVNRVQADQNREMEKLKERQAATRRAAVDKMTEKLDACKRDIRQTFTDALARIYQ